ncbi:UNVERIFIED_CONTAM: hypothetical protein K2H54_034803 [Gekko kuhli]
MTSQAHLPGPGPPSCPPTAPSLLLPAFPGAALLVTSADAPGSKLIIKLKREGPVVGGTEEVPRTQTFFLTGMPLGWAAPRRDGPSGPGVHTVLVTKAVEDPGGRKPRVPETVPPARAPPPSDASFACTSKGVYENYRRWQRYKALARCHFPATPDAEALACFFIPVLRSLARLRPDMTLEDGVPRAIQEWEHSSNFERMIFYEMAEKFMEFEAEEEQQIQKMKLLAGCSQFQAPVPKPAKLTPSPATESGQQQVYIPKKSASKSRQPRRRQRRPPSTSTPGAPREIPAEAVHQYAEIMEGLETSWEEEEDEKKEQGGCRDPRDQDDGMFPDPSLLQYIDQLCSDEEFVCKVEAVIHPQFIADLLSAEKSQDPLDLVEEMEEELNLTPNQLIEKRLLALSEEERDLSVCPTSHSDSTPSQSEEEDEAGNSGKGKETSSEAIKRTSADNGVRTSQAEMPGPGTSSLLVPSSHQHVGKRDFPPKAGRASLSSSLCGSHDSQAERALPTLKNTDERETQNLQKQNQVGLNLGQGKGIPSHAQWEKISPITAENNSLPGNRSPREDTIGQGVQRPRSTAGGRKDGRQGKVKGQDETQRAPEQVSHTAKAQSCEETQLVWKNLEPAHNACGKQGVQQRNVEHEQRSQAIWEGEEHIPKGIGYTNQNINKMLLGDHTSAERALQQNLNGHGERQFEKVIGHPQDQAIRGSEDTSGRTGFDNQGTGMKSQSDNQTNQFSEQLVPLECKNQDGGQREVLRDHIPGLNSALNAALPHCGSTVSCSENLARREHQMSVPAGSGKQPDGREAKVRLPKRPQISSEKTKCTPVKIKGSSGKALRCYADNLALSTATEQDGRQPSCLPVLETDWQVNCPVFTPSVELSGCKGNHLASTDSAEVRVLKGQQPRISTEHMSFPISSGLLSPSLSVQKDAGNPEKFRKAQWLYSDQGEVTPWVGNQPGIRQTLNLKPSDCIVAVEAEGGNCGPSGDHTPVPSSSSKRAEVISPRVSNRDDENDMLNQRAERSNLLSSEGQSEEGSSGSKVRNLGQVAEMQDLLEPATEASATLLELSVGNVEGGHRYGTKGEQEVEEEDEEDEELSSFSSLLASKLSLSPPCYHTPCPKEREDTAPASPTGNGKTVSKTRHSVRVQVPQEAIVLLSKNLGAHPTIHRSHKRKSNNLGTRRSKRLRNQ